MTSLVPLTGLECPITMRPMRDPVKAPDGHSYEREAITHWLSMHETSPLDPSRRMSINQLVTDYTLKGLIDELARAPTEESCVEPEIEAMASVPSHMGDNVIQEVAVQVPDGEAAPLRVCFVIDESGSMNNEVITASGESDGFTIMDVVQHGLRTCLLGMRPCDEVSLVAYSSDARVIMSRRKMDDSGKAQAKVAIAGLSPNASTNIWGGISCAFDQLSLGGTIFLLTDGQPNIRPPRGELYELQKKLDGRNDIVLNTYGFGYHLDSKLLFDLARNTQGSYGYIPDIGQVGTTFVHAMANLRTSIRKKLTLKIETSGELAPMPELAKFDWGYQLPLGQLTMGQPLGIHLVCDAPMRLSFDGNPIASTMVGSPKSQLQSCAAAGILECHQLAVYNTDRARLRLNELIGSLTATPDIVQDLNGQVREAIEPDAYRKWGRHYLPSLFLAHWTSRCNNFMDPGIQKYGGATFQKIRDELNTVFNGMPAPRPTRREQVVARAVAVGRAPAAQPMTMRSYNSSSAPCFAGPCRVRMADGSKKTCQRIRKGDRVATSTGHAVVRCVLKTRCAKGVAKLVKYDYLMVTPWHPIRMGTNWVFPNDLGEAYGYPCEAVYSFLLDEGFHDIIIESIPCITLAHGIDDPVAGHPFFGTNKVVEALSGLQGWSEGLVELNQNAGPSVCRDTETNMVCGFHQYITE